MTKQEFINKIGPIVQKMSNKYGFGVPSAVIAQACLESAYGTSNKANYHNYFGLKYRPNRLTVHSGTFMDGSSEQKANGQYIKITDQWFKFDSMEKGVEGYFQFVNTPNYKNLYGITNPKKYLENIKADGYATSLDYVANNVAVISAWNLQSFDKNLSWMDTAASDDLKMTQEANKMGYKFYTKLANPHNYGKKRNTADIKYIVIHYTAVDGDKAANNAKYFANNKNIGASAHYFVDDATVYQSVPDNYVAWAVGGAKYNTGGGRLHKVATNANTVSIELCDTVKNGTIAPTAATVNNALELTKQLMKKYNVPKDRVIRHYDVNGKPCPKYWINDDAWKNEFWSKLSGSATPAAKSASAATPPKPTSSGSFLVQVLVDDLNIRKGPGTGFAAVGTTGKGKFTIVQTDGDWGKLKSGAGWIYLGSSKYTKKVD